MPLLSFDYEKDVFGEEQYAGPMFFEGCKVLIK